MRESDLWIYAMGIYERRVGFQSQRPTAGQKLLQRLAETSGGRQFAVDSPADLPVVAARISLELRNEYILGYRPSDTPRDGKYHRVQVSLTASQRLHGCLAARLLWVGGITTPATALAMPRR